MNKKFFTLLAAAGLMATAVNAQVITYSNEGENTDTGVKDSRFPWTPFVSTTAPTKTINELKNIDKGKFEETLFQFKDDDDNLLAMQWDALAKKYQLVLATPDEDENLFMDETLWEVKAFTVGSSKDIRYVLVNKGAQLPLQLDPAGNDEGDKPAYVQGNVITWSWSDVAKNGSGLQGIFSAAVDDNKSIVLTDVTGGGIVKVEVKERNTALTGLKFTAYEAASVALNAAQINAMMTGNKTQAPVKFSMNPQIAGSEYGNALTDGTFTAWDNKYENNNAVDGEADYYQLGKTAFDDGAVAEGYVILSADNDRKNLLRVDTVYHNKAKDGRYELRLTTDEAKAPREAAVIEKDYNVADKALTKAVVKALRKQAQFRFQYYPSKQSIMVQAYQYMYLDKDATISWWKALYLANMGTPGTSFDATAIGGTAPATDYLAIPSVAKVQAVEDDNFVDVLTGKVTEVDQVVPAFVTLTNAALGSKYILSTATSWKNNLIKITTLTSSHSELTVGYDARDSKYSGINTLIQLGAYDQKTAAYIPSGYYYIKNGNQSTELLQNGYYRYHDLAATNYTQAVYNSDTQLWNVVNTNTSELMNKLGNIESLADLSLDFVFAEIPNTVYSPVKLENIPSAQWYISGEAGYYTITNRETGAVLQLNLEGLVGKLGGGYSLKSTPGLDDILGEIPDGVLTGNSLYLWEVVKDGKVVPNTFACKGWNDPNVNDTIVIEQVPVMDLKAGYLNISQEEAQLQTSVFDFKFASYGTDTMFVGQSDKVMKVLSDPNTQFKVERVRQIATDYYTGKTVSTIEDMPYGFPAMKDTLKRAMYRIYVEDVTSNATEGTGLRTRTYVTLDGGKYMLKEVVVKVDEDGYTEFDAKENPSFTTDPRKSFYIKHITTNNDEFVLIDPEAKTTVTELGITYKGARAFVNQQTGILQPAGLKSQGASNVFDSSVLSFSKVTKYNYRDIRREGIARDTVVLFKDGNPAIKLYESSAKGANISLLARDNKEQFTRNFAFFVDTANVDNADMPIFLLGLRPSDDEEVSNIPSHNKHLSTTADYLMVLTDSAKVNKAYMDTYGNIRLGFVNATHYADRTLKLTNSDRTFDLSKKALTPATFAFRYVDTDRDAFYIETAADNDGTRAWVKVINEVPVIVTDIKEAEVYNVEATSETPTANDNVIVSNVKVETTTGAVIVKNAAGKKVTVNTVLGQTLAETVASSDNATIAAPAGVVVVAVEGAEAVKAIVK